MLNFFLFIFLSQYKENRTDSFSWIYCTRILFSFNKNCHHASWDSRTFGVPLILTIFFSIHRYLKNPGKDADLRKWATEGLAYLTLDAEVKEELVEDEEALRSLIDLAKVRHTKYWKMHAQFSPFVCSIFTNIEIIYVMKGRKMQKIFA